MFNTKIKAIRHQALLVFLVMTITTVFVFFAFLATGLRTGLLEAQFIQPVKNAFVSLMEDSNEPTYRDTNTTRTRQEIYIEYNSGGETSVEYDYDGGNDSRNYNYTYPTSQPLPTFEPFPTSDFDYDQWKADFDKKREEIRTKNDALQKEVEENQKKFCEENPSLCD